MISHLLLGKMHGITGIIFRSTVMVRLVLLAFQAGLKIYFISCMA